MLLTRLKTPNHNWPRSIGGRKEDGRAEHGPKLPYLVVRVTGQNPLLSRLRIPALNCVGEIVHYERVCVISRLRNPDGNSQRFQCREHGGDRHD
jgi:hypothetical protein